MTGRDVAALHLSSESIAMCHFVGQRSFKHRYQIGRGAPGHGDLHAIDPDCARLAGMIHSQYVAQNCGIFHVPNPLNKLATFAPSASTA